MASPHLDLTVPPKEEEQEEWKSERGHDMSLSKAHRRPLTLTHLPLDIFPIRVEGMAKTACRYYTDIYAPATFRRPQFHGLAEDLPVLRHYIPLILSNQLSFAALLANSMLQFDLMDRQRVGPSPQAKGMYDVTIRLLRQYLQSADDKVSDVVICTMMFLATFDNLTFNYESAWMHLQAIIEAIARRGGAQQLGFDGWLANVTDSFIAHAECQRALVRRQGISTYTFKGLSRPVHPYSPVICAQIAKLPRAFEEVCINERPLIAVIDIISDVAAWVDAAKANTSEHTESHPSLNGTLIEANLTNGTKCFELLQNPHLPLQDQFLLMALQAYCSIMDYSERGRFLNLAYLQVHTGLLPSSFLFPDSTHRRSHQAEWLTWVGMMMLASSHIEALTWSLGMRILDEQELKHSWMQRIRICEKFFWNEQFSYQVLRKLEFKRKNPGTVRDKFSYLRR
ncbi:uncharacterized protein Z519_05396 [Cladophialophora bantiana CBS 173.52]|uniref:Transcription factor domain-containing protein n=1 Tax=Cladophialophora bantiana (strain ATCC 10958 / CBS 173.52 / CDC B-1940 / NIH 8579) TaxID=1442370 RepID=A0A0D2HTB7_CLAB1|nr:uncharacterized protein Z519_05396 [Cladophialophora bantiana CBS 173.52]KIW94080.1 hypothetical protein Z519_05396 [Cladophialophora bantiana CBS 173.52]